MEGVNPVCIESEPIVPILCGRKRTAGHFFKKIALYSCYQDIKLGKGGQQYNPEKTCSALVLRGLAARLLEKIISAPRTVFSWNAFSGPEKVQPMPFTAFWADTVYFRLCSLNFCL